MDSRSAFQEKIGHFLVKNDVTAAVRNRIWWSLFEFFVSLLCKIILSKFEVILLSRSRVWTWAVHFTNKFGHLIVKNDVTMAVRNQFSFYFFAKINYLYVGDYFGEVWSDSGKWNTKFHSRSGSNVFFLDFQTMFIKQRNVTTSKILLQAPFPIFHFSVCHILLIRTSAKF